MNEVSIDYIAGFIDGEGCFGVRPQRQTYLGRISIGNTDKNALSIIGLAIAEYGICATINNAHKATNTHKAAYALYISRQDDIKKMCQLLDGKLLIKEKQRKLMLEFLDVKSKFARRGTIAASAAEGEELAPYYCFMKMLNARGPSMLPSCVTDEQLRDGAREAVKKMRANVDAIPEHRVISTEDVVPRWTPDVN